MNETEIIKDKIQEILRTQKISKYDLALDIGISHATLYNFLTGKGISQKSLNKLAHFVRTYVTPEQKIEAYKLDAIEYEAEIKELKAKNEWLKEKIKTIKTSRKIWEAEALKQGCIKVVEVDKYKQTLQEIKRIAETCNSKINCEECPFTDECNTEMEALGVCKIILKLITKAEEE